jgi:plastocyanin
MARMHRIVTFGILACALFAAPGQASHCPGAGAIAPVTGAPGWFTIHTSRGTSLIHSPPPPRVGVTATYLIQALDHTWQSKPHDEDVPDTLIVPVGATVRWQEVLGFHTLTDGYGSDDPLAGTHFDFLLGTGAGFVSTFDSTFTQPTTLHYFCEFHDPMLGVLIVSSTLTAPLPIAQHTGFSRPPAPNPSLGGIAFAVTVASGEPAQVDVIDAAGRRIATLWSGVMNPGEHELRWDGRVGAGARAPAGIYLVRFAAGSTREVRRVTLLR